MSFALSRSPSSSPPAERRTPGTSQSLTPPAGDAPTPPTGLAALLAHGGIDLGGESSSVDKTAEQVAPQVVAPLTPFVEVESAGGADGKQKRRLAHDHIDAMMAGYHDAVAAETLMLKKPAAAKKRRKKVAEEESDDDDGSSVEDADDDGSSVDEAPHKGKAAPKAASKAATKAASKAAAKAKATLKAGKAPPSIAKKPAAVEFPKIPKEGSVYWEGGRVYVYKGKIPAVRAYARVGDRKDRRFGFKDKASLIEAWRSACQVIVDDDR